MLILDESLGRAYQVPGMPTATEMFLITLPAGLVGGGAAGQGVKVGAKAGLKSATLSAAKRGTVWDGVKATQPVYPGSVLPKSFELTAGNTKVWVHGNATEHIAEYASGLASRGATRTQVDLATQTQLESLQSAVTQATRGGVPYGGTVRAGGWELAFGAPRSAGQLPVLKHALYGG